MNRPPPPVVRPPPKDTTINKPKPVKSQNHSNNANREKILKIFFGTQTRTAEDFSHIIEKECKKLGISCEVVDLVDYDPEELANEYFVMFLVSTHGEGDPTDNAKDFYLWLTSDERPNGLLNNLPFTVFGLGNKTYEHYNAVARVMDKKLGDLGGKRIFERGEGDDDATLEEDFIHWRKRMWPVVCEHLGVELKSTEDDKFVPRFRMVKLTPEHKDSENIHTKINAPLLKPKLNNDNKVIYDIKNPYMATVTANRELHGKDSDRSCKHLEFDIGKNLHYTAGDHLGIYPVNDSLLVEALLQRLEVSGDTLFAMVPIDKAGSVIEASFGPMTLRKAFLEQLDITNPPRKAVLRTLSEYTNDQKHKSDLIRLASEEASEEYNQFIKHDCRTILEVLEAFPSVKPPISHILEFLPRLPARYYSISSSLNKSPERVTITSVVVNFTTPTQRFHQGVCSTWMSNLKVGDQVPIFIRESHFRLPTVTETTVKVPPIIMVGPGTGLAPFRGFLQELQFKRETVYTKEQTESSETMLFFGCRSDTVDYLYKEELLEYKESGIITELHVAFSRETKEKVYVQNKLLQHKEKVWKLLESGAHFYVCGDARNMAKQVQQSLLSIIKEYGNLNDDSEVQQFIDNMQKSNRYLQDVWF
ncbi:NADPH-cytochrome-P450 oxidoreductase [Tieghemostelium lacteum]|uniref:NADPH--hemoprotein reductase n=1 Tax=Tieghemostelium lacteum TaxID=361077 RepID=A0A152A3L9_TIELA|nr:NADPH-cytochrome-P450 oxidoreductase [Tieghemostelium lacteum]|eukprot:KYR00810.1 NADPH-cytochrome-P450 oxidoreductase [Tieghemostelium lacteum]